MSGDGKGASTRAQKIEMARAMRGQGGTRDEVARELGVSGQTIGRWCNPALAQREARRHQAETRERNATLAEARDLLEVQLGFDRARVEGPQNVLKARMLAVLDAARAMARREEGAHHGLRGACLDLASVSLLLVEQLPADAAELEREEAEAGERPASYA